jgi:subtilisin family serine protease
MKKFYILFFIVFLFFSFIFVKTAQANTFRANGPVQFKLHLTTSNNFIGVNKAYTNNFKGQNTYVVIIDSGVETTHSFLSGKVALEACFAIKCPDGSMSMVGPGAAKPVHWHGTHVAGIVAGSNSSMNGVAPEAKIIAINIFDVNGSTYDSNIIQALTWVDSISDKYNIAAVNMSLGTPMVFRSSCNSYIPNLTSIISKLKLKNIATVVSAGNSYSYGMGSPACITDTVSVAATYSDKNEVTNFSNIHEDTDLSAPGFNIVSSGLGSSFRQSSGTSMSAPFVSGAYALYRSKYGVQSVDKVTKDFQNSSVSAVDNYTKIISKRLDLNYLFGSVDIPVSPTTTVPSIPTTTVPKSSTTTVAPKPPSEDVEFGLTIPEITNIRKHFHDNNYLYLDFRYTSSLSNVDSYIFECTYINSPLFSRPLPNKGNKFNLYFVKISTLNIDSCRMAAVSKSGFIGQYTNYFKVK